MGLYSELVSLLLAFVVAITVHEAAHAFVADKLGDPTARLAGRLSLNPAVHYDPIGSSILLLTAFLSVIGIPTLVFGWAKPVPFDPYNLKSPRRDAALISIAGPISNLLVATATALVIRFVLIPQAPTSTILIGLLLPMIMLNVVLAVFNLLPIHPLDGGKILSALLSAQDARRFDMFMNRYGMMVILFAILPWFGGVSLLSMLISPVMNFILGILIPSGVLT